MHAKPIEGFMERVVYKFEEFLNEPWWVNEQAVIHGGHIFLFSLVILLAGIVVYMYTIMGQTTRKGCQARHILLLDETAALAVRARLDAGEKWMQLAKEMSVCPLSRDDGGDLGYFEPGQLDRAFDRICFNPDNRVGQVVGPFRTRHGWHLFRVDYRNGIKERDEIETEKDK